MNQPTVPSIEKPEAYPLDKLLFRRQFVLGPRFVERLKSWKRLKIQDSMYLTVHPDLPMLQTIYKNKSLTLLGYILDAYAPEANDLDILNRMIHQIESADDIVKYTESFGGRWILILDDGKDTILFNDAAGYRQAFYLDDSSQPLWVASQPGIIAEELNLKIDEVAQKEFIDSPQYKKNIEYWWPGDSSPYKEIKHLNANHYLNLRTRTCHRYWPDKPLECLPLEEGARTAGELLKGLIKAAAKRFDLGFTITAGFDTRLILAASREVNKNSTYYTMLVPHYGLTMESDDLKIPSELLAQLGLKHTIINIPDGMDKEFEQIYMRNVTTAHNGWGITAQGLYEHYPQNKVFVKGVQGNEIIKPHASVYGKHISAYTLTRFAELKGNRFAIKHFKKWLAEAREVSKKYNIPVVPLFGWEQLHGNWQAMSQLEWDIIQEAFSPFNCRKFLTTMICVEEKYRRLPDFTLYRKIIMNLWPEILEKPVNPGAGTLLTNFLIKAHLYMFIRRIVNGFREVTVRIRGLDNVD